MYKKKKIILVLMLIIALSGCANQENNRKSLYEHGMDVIALMEEMVSNRSYGSLMSSSDELEQMRQTLAAGDYTTPQAVYEMETPSIEDMFVFAESEAVFDSFSDSLKKILDNRSAATLVSVVNSHIGTAALASASMYTANKTFLSKETKENTLYLYTFQNGNPIAVAFTTGEDGTVTATGTFLMADGIDMESIEQLQNLLRESGFSGIIRQLPEVP